MEDSFDIDIEPVEAPEKSPEFKKDLYKKFGKDRFCSIRPWLDAGKIVVDIGKFNAESGKLESSSNAFLDMIRLATYLRAVANGQAKTLYPENKRLQVDSEEGVTFFGGGRIDGKPVSRIFKATYWPKGDSFDSAAFMWKVGHFQGTEQGKGIIAPNFKAPISVDSIKMERVEIAQISYVVDLHLIGHAARNQYWYDV